MATFQCPVLVQTWRELDARITDVTNESKDNLKYLSTLEQLCRPLYDGNLHSMLDSIPVLISNIQMIYAVSRYYNTSERMTSLYVRVWSRSSGSVWSSTGPQWLCLV